MGNNTGKSIGSNFGSDVHAAGLFIAAPGAR
jgi:hypothetical protein